jgi:tRNA pseudouridine13 synthase
VDEEECGVGIRAYMTAETPGFSGILKDRYSDFVVHEVDLAGRVVRLTDTATLPACHAAEEERARQAAVPQSLAELVGEDAARRFDEFTARPAELQFTFDAVGDRARRTAIHQAVRAMFPRGEFETSTDDGGHIVAVRGGQNAYASGNSARKPQHLQWPKDRPRYLSFALYKENTETSYALQCLGRKLGLWGGAIGFAGNKDKRAVTVQRVTAQRVDAKKLTALNGAMGTTLVGDFAYVDKPLRLGDLYGNRFELAIRDVDATEDHIAAAIASLRESGFINYYGLQRFGTGAVRTHEVGIALLKEEWQKAVTLIMQPHKRATEEALRARELFAAGNLQGCLDALPPGLHIEKGLVRALIEKPADFKAALEGIQRTSRLLYIHAYQSFVWNEMASVRIERYGKKVVAGDLIVVSRRTDSTAEAAASEPVEDPDGEAAVVRPLTEEEAVSGKYTIFDVVLPLPGTETTLPTNEIGEAYRRMLERDGLPIETIGTRRGLHALRGGYRELVEKPKDVEWSIVQYTDPTVQLIATDADRIRKTQLPCRFLPEPADPTAPKPTLRTALLIAFTLKSGRYATMCYRELLKQHTSAAYQTMLHAIANPTPVEPPAPVPAPSQSPDVIDCTPR